jgi:ribosomal protein S8
MVKNNLSLALSIIKNGSLSFKSCVHVPTTKLNLQLIHLLYKEGFIQSFFFNKTRINVFLKFNEFLKPSIKNIKILSTKGKQVITSHKTLCRLPKNSGVLIISSNKGLITLSEALYKYKVGGEVLCKII